MGIIRSISLALYICEVKETLAKQRQFADPIMEANKTKLSDNSSIMQEVPNANRHINVKDGSQFMSQQPIGCLHSAFNMEEPWKCFVDGLCYMLYTPLLLAGPTITFNDFIKQVGAPFAPFFYLFTLLIYNITFRKIAGLSLFYFIFMI